MKLFYMLFINLAFVAAEQTAEIGYCDAESKLCETALNPNDKLLFYKVNPPEGFNLRRDVYMRFAIMIANAKKSGKADNWRLVLPPWHRLYHWKYDDRSKPMSWATFFDVDSLKSYAPVVEFHEVFAQRSRKIPEINRFESDDHKSRFLEIDRIYLLQNFEDPFEGGTFVDKWELVKDCHYNAHYWDNDNIVERNFTCVKFQGKISKLWELISIDPEIKSVMFTNAEIALHDTYGTKTYWDCRKSMKFNNKLVKIANNYIKNVLDCKKDKCTNYVSVHWRRQDFARDRRDDVPSIKGTVKQIDDIIKKYRSNIRSIFIASDATISELNELVDRLRNLKYKAYFYSPTDSDRKKFKDGGTAIIDQIICSRSSYFIGTHESTFTFRIQEEREILGFDSNSTFNRLCPDTGKCEEPSKWTIVN